MSKTREGSVIEDVFGTAIEDVKGVMDRYQELVNRGLGVFDMVFINEAVISGACG